MEYSESSAQANEFAAQALAEMNRRKITPNPNNFAIWYLAASHGVPDLNRAIETLDAAGTPITDIQCAEFFERFLSTADADAVVAETSGELSKKMNEVLGSLATAEGDTTGYGDALGRFLNELDDLGIDEPARESISSALDLTREMAEKNLKLETELKSSSAEINRLREDMESLRHEAYTDGLTGLANRKKFDLALRYGAMTALESEEPISLLMMDIDHFKVFNDTHGHAFGDQVLRLLAETMQENIKGQDTAARYGGEEFTVILPNTSLEDAATVADQIRTAISRKKVRNRKTGDDLGRITVSIGVSSYITGEPLGQWVNRADQCLYLAKRQGRDRVCTSVDLDASEMSCSA